MTDEVFEKKVYLHFITSFRLKVALGLWMGCAPIFAFLIMIRIQSIEKKHNSDYALYLRCEWTLNDSIAN